MKKERKLEISDGDILKESEKYMENLDKQGKKANSAIFKINIR